jgi:hypothetical protein
VRDCLCGKAEQLRPDHIGGNRVRAGDYHSRFERVSADRAVPDHGRMPDGDCEVDRKALRHCRDEGMHIVEEVVSKQALSPEASGPVQAGQDGKSGKLNNRFHGSWNGAREDRSFRPCLLISSNSNVGS